MDDDTIVAVATAPGAGGIGIVRLSGPAATHVGSAITGKHLSPRHAHYCSFHDEQQQILDSGIALFFPGPNSFTGEDILELQAHGGPVILDLLLRECMRLGARQANPGEFSLRAYLNDKIDLTQAEAIADLIDSKTESAALNATRTLQGDFSKEIYTLVEKVTQLRILVEAAIDFPEEEIDFIKNEQVSSKLQSIVDSFENVETRARHGSVIQEGMKLVIAGKPNAGKSSLLNALSGQDVAIVTPIEGTTRDVLKELVHLDGMPLHIVDTAGLRDSNDEVEREGIRRAWNEIESADRVLLVIDATSSQSDNDLHLATVERDIPVTVVINKCDLTKQHTGIDSTPGTVTIHLSAKTGEGVELLRQHLKDCGGFSDSGEGHYSARRRHLLHLEEAKQHLLNGQTQLTDRGAGELLAEDLRMCQTSLGYITGAVSSDQLLGEIFSSFCIGK